MNVLGLFSVCLLLAANVLHAQTVGASLQGLVTDPAGASIPNAKVEVKNTATAIVATDETDAAGVYRFATLPPGVYEVRASSQGFQTLVEKGLTLAVGQAAVLNLNLRLGQTNTEITVQATALSVNTTSGAMSGLVDQKQMRDLPLNGRSFEQLALLQPGVSAAVAAGNDVVGGRGQKISVNGARPEQNSFLLDGSDINNVYNKTPGSVAGVLLGVEAVQEFQVLTNAYSAEFGRSSGGIINAITRSGTNEIHGSLFEFLRNSNLDARRYHDPFLPAFKRNQFGGVIGGPIHRNKTFFFAAFESLIERLGVTGITSVPDADARRGLLPGNRQVQLNPTSADWIAKLFPESNGRNLGGGIAEYVWNRAQPTNEYFLQGRIDHRFSERNTVFGRYTFSNGNVDRQIPNKPPIAFTKERSRNQYLTLEHQHLFSHDLLNTLRLSYARSVSEADTKRTVPMPASFLPPDPFGYLSITGVVAELAGDYRLPRNDRLNNYQWNDQVFWSRGIHALKLGVMGQRLQFNQDTTSQRGGIVTFTTLENFLIGRPSTIDFAIPGKIDPIRGYRQSVYAFYAQDDIRLSRRVSVNMGLRYEFATVPTEVNGKVANLRSITDTKITVGDPWHSNNSLKNFAPRLGVAIDPFGDGKTAIRAGFGLFYDLMLPKYYFFSGSLNPPFTTRTSIANPVFPNILTTPGFDPNRIAAQLQTVNFDLNPSYITQFNFNVQRALPGSIDLTVGYAGSRGKGLIRLGDANLAPERIVNGVKTYQPELGRRNPNFTGVFQRVTDSQSFYNSLQVSAARRFAKGFRAQLSYTWSKSIDDSSGINSQDYSNTIQYGLDWYDRAIDRGLSSFSAKHVFVTNWSWDVPLMRNGKGVAAAVLKGWQINNITALQTGMPFTVRLGFNRSGNLNTTSFSQNERPNLKAGCTSGDLVLGGPDRYFNLSCFELGAANQRGNAGRNIVIGPGFVSMDLSAVKSWALPGENRALQFRLESFNLPNHANFAVPSGAAQTTFTNAAGAIAPSWGRITSTIGVPRQLQLSLKLTF